MISSDYQLIHQDYYRPIWPAPLPDRRETAMAMHASDIERLIKVRIPDAEVTIRDLAGDGDHYAATVLSETFRGKSRVQQHQIVYDALKGEMGGKLHALALQTGTPER
jgi:stress-induced morphogen